MNLFVNDKADNGRSDKSANTCRAVGHTCYRRDWKPHRHDFIDLPVDDSKRLISLMMYNKIFISTKKPEQMAPLKPVTNVS